MRTVGEMIEALQQFDPSLPLLVDGYEGGYDDPVGPYLSFTSERGYEGYSGKYENNYSQYSTVPVAQQKVEHIAHMESVEWYGEPPVEVFDAVVIGR